MKMTLLEMVQDILSDMDSDNVNSFDDTLESEQVAQILKTTFFSIISTRDWAHLRQLVQLNPSGSSSLPTHMYVPDNVSRMVSINYDTRKAGETRKRFKAVTWREPDEFLMLMNQNNSDEDYIDVIADPAGVELLIRNDRAPTFYTSFDDRTLVFNSYDSEVDDTLQNAKTQAQAYVIPSWSMEDNFVPDLPEEAFIALLEEAKSRAMFRLKQMEDGKAEQESRRQQRWLSRNQWKVKGGIRYPDYGRKSNKRRKDPTFNKEN